MKFFSCLDLKREHLLLEVTALPTEPHPLPILFHSIKCRQHLRLQD